MKVANTQTWCQTLESTSCHLLISLMDAIVFKITSTEICATFYSELSISMMNSMSSLMEFQSTWMNYLKTTPNATDSCQDPLKSRVNKIWNQSVSAIAIKRRLQCRSI